MKRIVIFRFHKLPRICHERICLLKELNPAIEIYGLFGGENDQFATMREQLRAVTIDIYSIAPFTPAWKWRFGDLALREWFVHVGQGVSFDVAHLVEWDLLLCKSLDSFYSHIPVGSVSLTGVRFVKDIESHWQPTAMEPLSLEWHNLLAWAKRTHNYSSEPLACLGPGCSFPRAFLEGSAQIEIPEISTDELRLPLTAQLLDIPIVDNRLCRGWFVETELEIFNTVKKEVLASTIARELSLPKGRRCFHPFRKSFSEVQSQMQLADWQAIGIVKQV